MTLDKEFLVFVVILLPLIGLGFLQDTGLLNEASTYVKVGGSYVLGLVAVAVLFAVIGFAVSAGWRLGKRLDK